MNQDQFYAVRTARAWLKNQPLYLDTETTGLGNNDEIIDLALINSDGKTLIDTLIRPTVPISPSATAIHGITDADVADAPSFAEILPKLTELTEPTTGRLVLIYNASFDLRMLQQSASAHQLKLPYINADCVMMKYAQLHSKWTSYRNSYKWQSQANAAKQLGLNVPPDLHRAAADAQLCRAIVEAMAAVKLPGDEQ